MKIENWQRVAAQESGPDWTGDLDDDCTARWAGLILRAESMDRSRWWWAVTDLASGVEVDSSNKRAGDCPSGDTARRTAEEAARQYLSLPGR